MRSGRARAEKLTPERRREIARNAVLARWKRVKSTTKQGAFLLLGGERLKATFVALRRLFSRPRRALVYTLSEEGEPVLFVFSWPPFPVGSGMLAAFGLISLRQLALAS